MVVSRMRIALVAAALCAVAVEAGAAGLDARLSHSTVREGERVELRLRAPVDGDVRAPELAPLEKDFEILGQQQSQRISVVNGRREASVDWTITLLPRRKGEIVVPALRAGSVSSEPLELRVADAGPPPSRADAPDLFVESTVDRMSPRVQGEVRYTVKVYDGIGIREGGLTEPRVENASVVPAGEGRTYEETVQGRPYVVHEREYVITPQSSGKLAIPPVTLEARVRDPDARRRSPFDEFFGGNDPFAEMFGRTGFGSSFFDRLSPGREVRVRSNAIEIDVQPRPGGSDAAWFLPARDVRLEESFEPASPTFRVGEAVKRTVVLRALGASAEQLPAFDIPSPEGVRQYDEGSRDGSVPTDDGTVSVREQTVALVPSAAGEVVLPAVEVTWWDEGDEVERTATLPARTVEVLPAVGTRAAAPAPAAAPSAARAAAPEAPTRPAPEAPAPDVAGIAMDAPASLALAAAALLLAAGGGFALARRRRRVAPTASVAGVTEPDARVLLAEVQTACRAGDAASARDALVRWSRARFGASAPASPRAIASRLGHEGFAAEAARLDRSLYAPGADTFDGEPLWRELRAAVSAREAAPKKSGTAVLPELYPSA